MVTDYAEGELFQILEDDGSLPEEQVNCYKTWYYAKRLKISYTKASDKALALVAQLDVHPTEDQEVAGSTTAGRQHSFVEIDQEIFSMVILSLMLIQEGQY